MKIIIFVVIVVFGGWYYLVNFHYRPSSDEFLDNYLAKEANSSKEDDILLSEVPNEYNQQIMHHKSKYAKETKPNSENERTTENKKSSRTDPVSKIKYSIYEESAENYRCDGRKKCPQMHSCEEAKFFLKNCRGVKLDIDGNGIPCESQWCGGGVSFN